jgi:hypothetical protein
MSRIQMSVAVLAAASVLASAQALALERQAARTRPASVSTGSRPAGASSSHHPGSNRAVKPGKIAGKRHKHRIAVPAVQRVREAGDTRPSRKSHGQDGLAGKSHRQRSSATFSLMAAPCKGSTKCAPKKHDRLTQKGHRDNDGGGGK